MQFQCDSCGLCCCKAYLIPELSTLINDSGACIHFQDNQCNIYDSRPIVCNIDKYYNIFIDKRISKEEFYQQNYNYCMVLKSESIAGK